MKLIRASLELDAENFRIDAQIVELSYGHWEGQLAAELPMTDPAGVAQKTSDPFGWRPANGESYRDLQERVSAWLHDAREDTVAVTHGGVSRVARGAIFGIEDALVPFLDVPQDKILKLRDATMSWL